MAAFVPLPELAKVRRVVTGHTPNGTAVFEYDDEITPVNPIPEGTGTGLSAGFTLIHQTQGYPVKSQGSAEELRVENLHRSKGGGIVCQIVDFPPHKRGVPVYLHRNQSLDYLVILKGTINAILDNGVEKTLREGDVMVQRGTMHAWKNVSSENCRFMTVIIPSEHVKVEATGAILGVSKIPGLSD